MAIQKYIVIFFQGGKDAFITHPVAYHLQSRLDSVINTKPEDTEIDMWLESPGGSAHAAYKMWLELYARASKLRVWIPDCAKSAATLLALGMDELYMSIGAELGPLDVQIEHPDRENITISALDVAGSLDYLSQFSVELAIMGGAALVTYTKLARSDILKEILPFAAKLIEPCVKKIDPHLTRRAVSQLKVAEHYADRMLRKRRLQQGEQLSKSAAKKLIHTLVHEYPVHECVIGRNEAKQLGLPVYDAEGKPGWPRVKREYKQFMRNLLSGEESLTVLDVIPEPLSSNSPKVKKKKAKKKRKKKKK